MKFPFVLRKKYEELELLAKDLENDVIEHETAYKHIVEDLSTLKEEYIELMGDMVALKQKLHDRECELKLSEEFNEETMNKMCDLNSKLIESYTVNESNEEKIKELEFCLNEAKKECKNQLEIIKRTNIVKNLLVNLTALKDNQGRVLVEEKCVITHDKVPANKVYEIARLLG